MIARCRTFWSHNAQDSGPDADAIPTLHDFDGPRLRAVLQFVSLIGTNLIAITESQVASHDQKIVRVYYWATS